MHGISSLFYLSSIHRLELGPSLFLLNLPLIRDKYIFCFWFEVKNASRLKKGGLRQRKRIKLVLAIKESGHYHVMNFSTRNDVIDVLKRNIKESKR